MIRRLMKISGATAVLAAWLLFVSYLINTVAGIHTAHGIRQASEMYIQPKNSIDVVMMGSSHIHCNVNTALLWEKYGIAAYDYSAAEQPLWLTYYYLREICKTQDPKLVVLDLYSPARYTDDHQYDWLVDNLMGVRFSFNKVKMMLVSSSFRMLPDYFPSFQVNHSRYIEVEEEDWERLTQSVEERQSFKGYTPYFKVREQTEPEMDHPHSGELTEKSERYLHKIIDYCQANDIELFLIVAPYATTPDDELVYNRVREIAEEEKLEFHSANYYYDHMNLNFATDFHDDSHLNYVGSCKFSDYLGKELKERFDIPDRRGDEKYESWDRHVEAINQEVEDELKRQQEMLQNLTGSGAS